MVKYPNMQGKPFPKEERVHVVTSFIKKFVSASRTFPTELQKQYPNFPWRSIIWCIYPYTAKMGEEIDPEKPHVHHLICEGQAEKLQSISVCENDYVSDEIQKSNSPRGNIWKKTKARYLRSQTQVLLGKRRNLLPILILFFTMFCHEVEV